MIKLNATNETWLSKLRDHLKKDRYKSGSIAQRLSVSRHFLTYLQARQMAVATVQPADVERYLQQTAWLYPDRHQESPDYRHWRLSPV